MPSLSVFSDGMGFSMFSVNYPIFCFQWPRKPEQDQVIANRVLFGISITRCFFLWSYGAQDLFCRIGLDGHQVLDRKEGLSLGYIDDIFFSSI